jgi:geranylgeranyl diphosphate synthase type II
MISYEHFAKEMNLSIDKTLEDFFAHLDIPELQRASLYALEGGKRVRPLLMLATVASFSPKSLKKAFLPAACLELIHTYSLIHDDLPCMDDDDFRRGRKSLHKAFPEWLALLTGDFLLTYAFEAISSDRELSSEEKSELILVLSSRCGGSGMIGGQIEDMMFQGKKISLEQLKKMQEKKTGFLFMAAMEFGAILCHISLPQRKMLVSFGETIGLAYQIIDDLADHLDTKGSDLLLEKATWISLLGKEKAMQMAVHLLKEAEDLLSNMQKADLLLNFVSLLRKKL